MSFGRCPKILPRKSMKVLIRETDGIFRLLGAGSVGSSLAWVPGVSDGLELGELSEGSSYTISVICMRVCGRCLSASKVVCPIRPLKST